MAKLFERGLDREGLASWSRSSRRDRTSREGKNIFLIDQLSAPDTQSVENAIVSLIPTIDLLVVLGTVGGVAAKKLVTTKPVVFISVGAPIDIGLVARFN